jgi:hypothetical protein
MAQVNLKHVAMKQIIFPRVLRLHNFVFLFLMGDKLFVSISLVLSIAAIKEEKEGNFGQVFGKSWEIHSHAEPSIQQLYEFSFLVFESVKKISENNHENKERGTRTR